MHLSLSSREAAAAARPFVDIPVDPSTRVRDVLRTCRLPSQDAVTAQHRLLVSVGTSSERRLFSEQLLLPLVQKAHANRQPLSFVVRRYRPPPAPAPVRAASAPVSPSTAAPARPPRPFSTLGEF